MIVKDTTTIYDFGNYNKDEINDRFSIILKVMNIVTLLRRLNFMSQDMHVNALSNYLKTLDV